MAMTLSAVMNLTGNFAAQIQANAQALQGMAQQASQAGNTIKSSLSDNIANMGQKISSSLSQAKDAIGVAGIASLGLLKSSADAAAGAQKVNADLVQVIKSTGGAAGLTADQVADMAGQLSKTNLASKIAIEQGQDMLLTFTNIGKDVFPQASQAMVDLAQKMGGDPVNSAIQLGKALNDPTTGLTTLTRVGVTFTDQQKQQIQAMQQAGDMAGAQTVILNELNKEFGGQGAAALQTYNGQMQKFGQMLIGIKASIGSVLLPYLTEIAQKLNTGAQAVANFSNEHKTLIAVILSVTGALGTLIGGASLFSHLSSFFGPTVQQILNYLKDLPVPIFEIIAVIGLLVAAYTTNFLGFKYAVDSFIKPIISAFQSAIDTFKNTGDVVQALGVFFTNAFGSNVGNTVISTLTLIKNIIMSLINTVKAHMPEIKSTIQTVFQGIQAVWNSILKPVLSFIISTIGQVVNWVIANWPLISKTISTVMSAIWSVISSILSAVQAFWNTWGQTIIDYVSMCFNNIKITISTVIKVIEDIIKAVMQVINGDWSGAWQSICDAASTIFGGVIDIIQNVIDGVGSIFSDIATVAYNWGKDMIDGIVNGIKGAIGDVEDAAKGIASTITSYIHFSVPDKGPLTQFEQWMPDFMQGLGNGIKVSTHFVTDPIKDLSLGIKTNTLNGLSGGVAQIKTQSSASKSNSPRSIQIAKLADSIVVREESDIDKIATALANKLIQLEHGMD
jgi:phage-related protein